MLERVTRGYQLLQRVTRGYKRLQGVTRGYQGLQRVTRGYKGLQGVTMGYRGLQLFTGDYNLDCLRLFIRRISSQQYIEHVRLNYRSPYNRKINMYRNR